METPLDYNSTLTVGTYELRFKSAVIPEEWLTAILNTFKDLFGWGLEVIDGKPIKILSANVETNPDQTKFIVLKFQLLKNPVPVAAVVLAILAVLGIFGAFLTFDSISKITENPVIGTGIGLGIILLVIAGVIWLAGNYKKLLTG